MNTVSVLYYLKRDHPDVSEDKRYLCHKHIAHIGMPNGAADLPTLQWGSKEEAAKYDEVYAEFFITIAERADNNARKLNQCIDAYNALRKGD